MRAGDRVAIVGNSNGLSPDKRPQMEVLQKTLTGIGLVPVCSEYLYEKGSVFSGSARERAEAMMRFYRDDSIKAIFDVSGGDLANEVLDHLDFTVIAGSEKEFWGYSDLTTIVNAIYAKTGKASVLYQVRNLVGSCMEQQVCDFSETVLAGADSLYKFPYHFLQGSEMEGILVGGNIRCLLKLAGTEYWPDMKGKILLLEAWSGMHAQMTTYLSQLKQLKVFEQVQGIILGTFTKMEAEHAVPSMEKLVCGYAGEGIPVAKTDRIGHGKDSKAVRIGENIRLV